MEKRKSKEFPLFYSGAVQGGSYILHGFVLNCFVDRAFSGMGWHQATLKGEVAQLLTQKKVTFVSCGKAGRKACCQDRLVSIRHLLETTGLALPHKQMADTCAVLPLCSLLPFRIGGYKPLVLIFLCS